MEGMEKKCYLWSPYCVPAPHWGCLKRAKSCALVVLTKDSALFSLQLVLWPSVCLCLSSLCSGEGLLSSAHLPWHSRYLLWLQCLICVLDKGLSHHLHSPLLTFLVPAGNEIDSPIQKSQYWPRFWHNGRGPRFHSYEREPGETKVSFGPVKA